MEIFYRLLKYKDLFLVFIWREFSIRYKQSLIGLLWAILQPVSMMLLFTLVFTYAMPIKVSSYPYPLFFYSALLPWNLFSSSLNYAIPSLSNHYSLITKIYFPREIIPLAGVAVAFIDFLIAFSFLLFLFFYYHCPFNLSIIWIIPLLCMLLIFASAISLILASLNVYYRDVKLATGFIIQLWFFATPVIYSIDKLPPKLKLIAYLNPMSFIVENARRCLIEGKGVIWWQYLIMLAFVVIVFQVCYRIFLIMEKRFADVI